MKDLITGTTTALITPFKNGKLDEQVFAKLIQRQIDNNIDAVCPAGTTGESGTLTHDEHKRCIEIAVEVCKNSKTKVLAGAGSNSTIEAIHIAKHAEEIGADAIFSVSPYYNKPSQEGLYQHYKSIASSVSLPFMLYNVPSRTGVDILPETVKRLFNDVSNIIGIKEATGSVNRTIEILNMVPEIYLFSGDDALDYSILVNGGKGITSVTSNLLPDLKSELVRNTINKDYTNGKRISDELLKINQILFCESNPIPIKYAMYISGLIDTLEYRLPLTPPNKENMKQIENILNNYKVVGF